MSFYQTFELMIWLPITPDNPCGLGSEFSQINTLSYWWKNCNPMNFSKIPGILHSLLRFFYNIPLFSENFFKKM